MLTQTDLLDRAWRENQVMTDLVRLTATEQEYAEVMRGVLNLVENIVSSPVLCLSVQEFGEVGHYARAAPGVDAAWAEQAGREIARGQEQLLHRVGPGSRRGETYLSGPTIWFLAFPVMTRSGRTCSLALGSPEPLQVDREEEKLLWRVVEQVALVLDHVLLLEQIEHLETTDRLTGLVNHRRLLDLLDYEMQRHRYAGKRLALLLFDVEGLDGINRSYGRRYGNHILQKLAALIKETARPIDVVARSGLDEFAVMLPETDEEEAGHWLDTLRERLLTVEFAGGDVGLSAAVTHIKPGEMLTPENFLRRAEQALREAKRQQRDWSARLS